MSSTKLAYMLIKDCRVSVPPEIDIMFILCVYIFGIILL